jgi:hypothetical protein
MTNNGVISIKCKTQFNHYNIVPPELKCKQNEARVTLRPNLSEFNKVLFKHHVVIILCLSSIAGERANGIILVLLHFRSNDTRMGLFDDLYKKDYPDITVYGCLLQQDFENIKEVNKKIKKDLKQRHTRQRDKHKSRQACATT